MNEQIQKLYKQAAEYAQQQEPTDLIAAQVVWHTKFAELIIQECADVCQGFGESGDGYTCSYEILEHFGVK